MSFAQTQNKKNTLFFFFDDRMTFEFLQFLFCCVNSFLGAEIPHISSRCCEEHSAKSCSETDKKNHAKPKKKKPKKRKKKRTKKYPNQPVLTKTQSLLSQSLFFLLASFLSFCDLHFFLVSSRMHKNPSQSPKRTDSSLESDPTCFCEFKCFRFCWWLCCIF